MEKGKTLHEGALFADLEKSDITILMGSRAFFESWDSNRPNVINFINIAQAPKQKNSSPNPSGAACVLEPLPGHRKACRICCPALPPKERAAMDALHEFVDAPEKLFIYATNGAAIKTVMEQIKTIKTICLIFAFVGICSNQKADIQRQTDVFIGAVLSNRQYAANAHVFWT